MFRARARGVPRAEAFDTGTGPGRRCGGARARAISQGSFGQVVQAYDRKCQLDVAIKIIKSKKPFALQARTEIELLCTLRMGDQEDEHNIVRLLNHFQYRNHQCLVFEMLS